MFIERLWIRSVPDERDIITRSLRPRLASQAPNDRRTILKILRFIDEWIRNIGTERTRLSVRLSKVRRVINRWDCWVIKAIVVSAGARININVIDLRSCRPIFDLQDQCFILAFKSGQMTQKCEWRYPKSLF